MFTLDLLPDGKYLCRVFSASSVESSVTGRLRLRVSFRPLKDNRLIFDYRIFPRSSDENTTLVKTRVQELSNAFRTITKARRSALFDRNRFTPTTLNRIAKAITGRHVTVRTRLEMVDGTVHVRVAALYPPTRTDLVVTLENVTSTQEPEPDDSPIDARRFATL